MTSAHLLRALIDGRPVNGHLASLPQELMGIAQAILAAPPSANERTRAFEAAISGRHDSAEIRAAVFAADPDADLNGLIEPSAPLRLDDIPELPGYACIDPIVGAEACPWLNSYIAFSQKWSPRSYYDMHEACGLFVLSTVAARRVRVHLGRPRYSNLMIALTARTSLYTKTSAAEIGLQTLEEANLSWLLTADSATPQKFIFDLTTRLPNNYTELKAEQQEIARLRAGLAGQRGWYYEEFGQQVAGMMREGGIMADFRSLLRRWDDTPERYEYGTIGRGSDIVDRPYLALLANLTPDDLRPFARRGSGLWGDGFLARIALVTPPDGERLRGRFPAGERVVPSELLTPLVNWHRRLGLPKVVVTDEVVKNDKLIGSSRVVVTPTDPVTLELAPDVYEAFYTYHDALLDLLEVNENHDLDGNYARMAEKALRVALLLASVTDSPRVELTHWARAQTISEEWRAGLHRIYEQINRTPVSKDSQNEEKIMTLIQRLKHPTRRELHQYTGLSYSEIDRYLIELMHAEMVEEANSGKTKRYILANE